MLQGMFVVFAMDPTLMGLIGVVIGAGVAWRAHCPATINRPVALFYSRFHRKKRLRELFNLWVAAPRGDWLLLIAGVPEEYSVAEVQGWIKAATGAEFHDFADVLDVAKDDSICFRPSERRPGFFQAAGFPEE